MTFRLPDNSTDSLSSQLTRIELKLDQLLASRGADDNDLDGQWGDPEVRKDPKRWDGESMVGRRYSETSPEFLRCLAGFLTWKADKNSENVSDEKAQKYAVYDQRDAARALGWAKRLESGWQAPRASRPSSRAKKSEARWNEPPAPQTDDDENLPF